jgi:hypothetical protein
MMANNIESCHLALLGLALYMWRRLVSFGSDLVGATAALLHLICRLVQYSIWKSPFLFEGSK